MSPFALRLVSLVAFALGVLCVPMTASAAPATKPIAVCVQRATADMTALIVARARGFDCTTPQTSLGDGDYWVRSAPLSVTGPVHVRIGSLWQRRVTLHAFYADGAVIPVAIDGHGATRRLQLGAIIDQPLPARAAPLVRLVWHVEGSANMRGILIGATIDDAATVAQSNLRLGALYAGFAGLCVALLVYNLALWGALRHRFQLAYCAMVFGLLVYAFSSSGAMAWAWPTMLNNDRLRINYVSLACSAVAAVAFARAFFESTVFAGWLGRASVIVCGVLLGLAGLVVLAPSSQIVAFDRVYTLCFSAQLAIILPVLWRAWRQRSNYLWMFALAWGAPIVFACIRVAHALHAIGWSFWLDNSTIVSMTAEALLSSLAIAYRIRLLSRERDEAREQEIAARLLADTDPLTGLLNRRAFLRHAIGREGDQRLLLADIDHFKRVNETIGHDGGDEVLRVFARTLRQSVPADTLVARIGGEEFAIVTPAACALEAEDILARLRAGRMPFDLSVTASIGTCTGPLTCETDWKMLYRGADQALFEAKAAGRDRARGAALASRFAA